MNVTVQMDVDGGPDFDYRFPLVGRFPLVDLFPLDERVPFLTPRRLAA